MNTPDNLNWNLSTPVCITVFNRPDTTLRVFEAIRNAKPPMLLVIADGPRPDKPGEHEKCAEALAIINQVDWRCEVVTNIAKENLGIRKRIAGGLKWLFDTVEEAIILEHDCLPHPSFFRFCQEMLEHFRYNEQIALISGNNNQLGSKWQYSYYFSRYTHMWGWASWRRTFQNYDETMAQWPQLRDSHFLENIFR